MSNGIQKSRGEILRVKKKWCRSVCLSELLNSAINTIEFKFEKKNGQHINKLKGLYKYYLFTFCFDVLVFFLILFVFVLSFNPSSTRFVRWDEETNKNLLSLRLDFCFDRLSKAVICNSNQMSCTNVLYQLK